VYPAGGQQGQTFEVTLGGQGLTGVTDVFFSGSGIEATVVAHERPLTPKETELLRDKLKALEEKAKAEKQSASASTSAGDEAEMAAIREKIAKFGNGPMFNVAIAENVKLRVTAAPDATLGEQEIRVATPGGLSNPLVFCIGQHPEWSEPAARGSLKAEIDSKPRGKRRRDPSKTEAATERLITATLPAVVNGQILPGEEDRFRFTARKDQRVLVAVSARKLIPYLPDAVPGWFQATVALCDAQGRELAYADDFRFHPDPAFCYVVPADGEYEVAIRDSIYRGREDFVYRVTLGELPFVTSIFPLGGSAGGQSTIELRGWNLTAPALALDLKGAKPGLLPIVTTRGGAVSNFVPFAVDRLPEAMEKEPNNVPLAAQPLTPPQIVNGRIDQPGDTDVFRIRGKAGDEIVAEVYARRLNSPVDSALRLTDAKSKLIAVNDDHEDKGAGLSTHHADSRLSVKLPADGAYLLHLSDSQRSGGPDYGYRLRVGPLQPDFELRVTPSSISGRTGASVPITIHVLRRDGFTGEVALALKGAPEGFKLAGGGVPAGKDQAKLTLTLSAPTDQPLVIEIEGRARIGDAEVVRTAVPAEDMQQAFAYHHLVPAKELKVAVAGKLVETGSAKIASALPLRVAPGAVARVRVSAAFGEKSAGLQLELSDPPAGIEMRNVAITPEGAEFDVAFDAGKIVPGEKGNLIVQAFASAAPRKAGGKPRRIPLGALPAISFEVPGSEVASTP
jgi:hypothetical protein